MEYLSVLESPILPAKKYVVILIFTVAFGKIREY